MERTKQITPGELIAQLHRTVDRLAEDGADRGDVKILARTMRELSSAFRVLGGLKGHRKAAVFGSARCGPGDPAWREAEAFGRGMSARGWIVMTGGGGGIMEAAHRGAGRERALGINILLPFEQLPNPVIAGQPRLINVKYFFTRKLLFVKEADAVALFPGGFGTLDEAFEVLTLLQTGKSRLFPVVLVDERGGSYWRSFTEFVAGELLGRGLVSPEDLALFRRADGAAAAADEIAGFYRVFHSMRTVGKDLVIRLGSPLSDGAIRRVERRFADLLPGGSFRRGGALPEERDEPELAGLPRLAFRFDRKSHGRLRMLVDALNEEGR